METYFTEVELKAISFQELAERYFVACARKDEERAHKIAYRDFERKLQLEFARVFSEAVHWRDKMLECKAACALDD